MGRSLAQLVDRLALRVGGELADQGVLGRHDGIRHAEAGVGPGGEDPHGDVGLALDGEVELGALGAADPVALHRLGPLGPLEVVEGVQELVGVLGDAEEPLLEVPPLDHVARAVAGAVGQDLLVGQHGLAAGAPVDRGEGAVGQTGLPEAQEDGLGPLDVGRIVAAYLAAPVVDGPEAGERRGELGNPGFGEDAGVGPGLDGGVLGRQAEGVEADRAENALALHGLVANDQVTKGVVAHVALVGRPGGVGVHAQGVELLARVVVVDLVRAGIDPVALPLGFHRLDVVGACHASRVREAGWCPEQGLGNSWPVGAHPAGPTRSGAAPLGPAAPDSPAGLIRPQIAPAPRYLGAQCAGPLDTPARRSFAREPVAATAILNPHHWGRSSAGRAPDWQSGGSWVQVPSPPPNFW